MAKVNSCRDGHELFRIAKQWAGEKRSVVWVSCLKDETGIVRRCSEESGG